MDYTDQLNRIKQKLDKVRKLDPKGERSFGAEYHRYRLGKPLSEKEITTFETELGISLPEEYRAFLANVGSGFDDAYIGNYSYDGAGPYYGIYSLTKIREEYESYESTSNPKRECVVYPYMSSERWEEICIDENLWPYNGMLVFGSQGCAFAMMLILNGEYRGRITSMDWDRYGPPHFAFENNFLDWYERWLDEIIGGYSIDGFGFTVGGDEQTLIRLFRESDHEKLKETIIKSFAKFPRLSEESLLFLEEVIRRQPILSKCKAIQMLTKFDYARSKPFLIEAVRGSEKEKLAAFQAIVWYAKKHYIEWTKPIFSELSNIQEEETFGFASTILDDNKEYFKTLQAIHRPLSFVRKKLIEKLGQTSKPNNLDLFYEGFEDSSDDIVLATVESVRLIIEPTFLPYFDKLIDKYSKRYDKKRSENPTDFDLALETDIHEKMCKEVPQLVWMPRTIESTILWRIVGCLKMYGPNADILLEKIAELQNNPVAVIAKQEIESRQRIREKQKNRKTFWAKLKRILLWQ